MEEKVMTQSDCCGGQMSESHEPHSITPNLDHNTVVRMLSYIHEAALTVTLQAADRHKFLRRQTSQEYQRIEERLISERDAMKKKFDLEIFWLKKRIEELERLAGERTEAIAKLADREQELVNIVAEKNTLITGLGDALKTLEAKLAASDDRNGKLNREVISRGSELISLRKALAKSRRKK